MWEVGSKVDNVVVWKFQDLEGCVVCESLRVEIWDVIMREIQLLQVGYEVQTLTNESCLVQLTVSKHRGLGYDLAMKGRKTITWTNND